MKHDDLYGEALGNSGSHLKEMSKEEREIVIEELVKEEFNLQSVPFEIKIDEHWEIVHGWSEEYGL